MEASRNCAKICLKKIVKLPNEHGIQESTSKCMELERNVNAHLHSAVDQKNRETFKEMKDEIIFLEKKLLL